MEPGALDEERMKQVIRAAIEEQFRERRGPLYDFVTKYIEDGALSKAIEEGEKTGKVGRDAVFKALESES